jgi:hypothetical protein
MTYFFSRALFAGLFCTLIFSAALAQKTPDEPRTPLLCGAESLPPAERKALEAQVALALRIKKATTQAVAITYVPIRPHIIRRADGTGGYSMKSLNNVMALTNSYYLKNGVGIQFFFSGTTPDYVDNDALFTVFVDDGNQAGYTAIAPLNVNNAMNQYYVQKLSSGYGGKASYPGNYSASTQSVVIDENWDEDMGNRLVPHELGHNFNLIHTFDNSNGYELITRGAGANCTTAGDLVCDTPADPYSRFPGASASCVSGCPATYTCGYTEPGTGAVYAPSPNNIMSYYFPCTHDFTPGQYDRIDGGLALRQSHTAYSLTAVSTNVTPASNLVVNLVNGKSVLTWTDNANNEMGYFIERSTTSANTGFIPIGGVAPNITTFTDASAPSLVRAYYRVRPSNSTGNISNTATIDLPICQPSFANGCSQFSTGLGSFSFNAQALSQNSGCSPSSYGQFTAVTPAVTAGNSYTFAATLINTWNVMRLTFWADFNQNGSFAEANELVYQTPASTVNVITGSITIPASTSAGIVRLRLIALSSSSTNAGAPCGSYSYGEAEDYQLNVIDAPACVVMTTTKAGSWNDPTVWSCNRVPVSNDVVSVGHIVTVPANAICKALKVSYTASGKVLYNTGGKLNLGISN